MIRNPSPAAIGVPVIGGTAGRILFTDSSGLLGNSANLLWDNTNGKVTIKALVNAAQTLLVQNSSGTAFLSVDTRAAGSPVLTFGGSGISYTAANISTFQGSMAASSGTQHLHNLVPTVAQSGTAGYDAFFLNVTESSTGSGTKFLVRLQVGAADKWAVDNTGTPNVFNDTTGATTLVLPTNSPAASGANAYTHLKFISSDGSTVWVPAYK